MHVALGDQKGKQGLQGLLCLAASLWQQALLQMVQDETISFYL